jgi:glycosyltransferase involved in cell wall biosynthesis
VADKASTLTWDKSFEYMMEVFAMSHDAPKISVVTTSLNARDTIEQTLQSVLSQTYAALEYVVVDGGSTDGTAKIIRRYETRIFALVSEPDNGIADAMNKGIALTTGDLIFFLHSDDYLLDARTLTSAIEAIRESKADIYAFEIDFGSDKGWSRLRPRGFDWRMYFKGGIYHQAALCRRSLFERIGHFDTSLKIAMDYDFFLRAYLAGATVQRIPLPLSFMRNAGISGQRDWVSLMRRFREEQVVQQRQVNTLPMRIVYKIYWPLYLSYRFIRAFLFTILRW